MNRYDGRGLHGHIVEQVGSRIVGGTYLPGATLFAEALEDDFAVSKTVVREALKVLAAKGLVESRQRRGTVVRPRRAWNLLDGDVLRWHCTHPDSHGFIDAVAEVTTILETSVVTLAAERRNDADLAAIEDALAEMGRDLPDDTVVMAQLRFHCAILDATHNELLQRTDVLLSARATVCTQFVRDGRMRPSSIVMHRAMFDAIKAKDPVRAVQVATELMELANQELLAAAR